MKLTMALCLAVLAVYVGGYFALVNTQRTPSGDLVPVYRIEHALIEAAFAPLHELDRDFLRTDYWGSRP